MKITKFQIIVLVLFVIFTIAGVATFATYRGKAQENTLPPITIWGTFPKATFDQYIGKVNNTLASPITVTYVQESQATFLSNFIAALARGRGPDAILVPADVLLPTEDKLAPIPYSVLPSRTFLNTFVDEARVYLGKEGVMGVPFSIDPMVMYWNRDLYNSSGVAVPPKYWDEFTALAPKLTKKDDNGNILQAQIAMGDFSNTDYARELLGTLMLQVGNPITQLNSNNYVESTLKASNGAGDTTPALKYFTQFVDPASDSYSWNRSWPNSKTAFLSGKLTTYFGLASELYKLRQRNPNLNFDVSPIPQFRTGGVAATYARMYGFSIVKASANANAAYQIISILTAPSNLVTISNDLYLPSVSRAIIASGSNDPYIAIFNDSALISRAWRDSDPNESWQIFSDMIQAVTSGQKPIYQAVGDASNDYNNALRRAAGQ